jgi:hypothetical protein
MCVRRAKRSVSSDVSRRIHSDATRLIMLNAERSAPHSDYGQMSISPSSGFPLTATM